MLATLSFEAVDDGSLTATLWLAVIQGLTEFLPISSSGHLVLGGELLGVSGDGVLRAVMLHVGTLAAVVTLYGRDLGRLARDACRGSWREVGLLALATVPAGVVGLTLHAPLKGLFESPTAAALGLLGTAAILFTAERSHRVQRRSLPPGVEGEARPLGWRTALLIGLAQAVAILPGVSRSGSTIAAGIVCGLPGWQAARFSFLLSVPVIAGAALLEGLGGAEDPSAPVPWSELVLGMLVAAVVGFVALRFLLAFVGRGIFRWFATYCAVVGGGWLLLG